MTVSLYTAICLHFSYPASPNRWISTSQILKLMDQFVVFKNHVFNNMICYKNKHFTNKLHKAKHQFLQLKSFQHVTVYFPPSLTWVPQCLLYLCDHQQRRGKKKEQKKKKKKKKFKCIFCRCPGSSSPADAAVWWHRSWARSEPLVAFR